MTTVQSSSSDSCRHHNNRVSISTLCGSPPLCWYRCEFDNLGKGDFEVENAATAEQNSFPSENSNIECSFKSFAEIRHAFRKHFDCDFFFDELLDFDEIREEIIGGSDISFFLDGDNGDDNAHLEARLSGAVFTTTITAEQIDFMMLKAPGNPRRLL